MTKSEQDLLQSFIAARNVSKFETDTRQHFTFGATPYMLPARMIMYTMQKDGEKLVYAYYKCIDDKHLFHGAADEVHELIHIRANGGICIHNQYRVNGYIAPELRNVLNDIAAQRVR